MGLYDANVRRRRLHSEKKMLRDRAEARLKEAPQSWQDILDLLNNLMIVICGLLLLSIHIPTRRALDILVLLGRPKFPGVGQNPYILRKARLREDQPLKAIMNKQMK